MIPEEPGLIGSGVRDQGLVSREFQPEFITQEFSDPPLDLLGLFLGSDESEEEVIGIPDITESSISGVKFVFRRTDPPKLAPEGFQNFFRSPVFFASADLMEQLG